MSLVGSRTTTSRVRLSTGFDGRLPRQRAYGARVLERLDDELRDMERQRGDDGGRLMADTVVHWFWGIMLAVAIISIAYASRSAWRSTASETLYWRGVKIGSSALGIVGLGLLLLNFEQVVRSTMIDSANDYAFTAFLEAKFYSTRQAAIACATAPTTQDGRNHCFDYNNLDGQLSFDRYRTHGLTKMTNWQRVPTLEPVIEQLNRDIDRINSSRAMRAIPPTFGAEARLQISLFSTLLVILALAGGIGESIFQYKQERDKRSNTTHA